MGVFRLGEREALAYTEMARGLLVHWTRLVPDRGAGTWRVEDYRLLAPTDWNFHPNGALARYLRKTPPAGHDTLRLLVAALDPCMPVAFAPTPGGQQAPPEAPHA